MWYNLLFLKQNKDARRLEQELEDSKAKLEKLSQALQDKEEQLATMDSDYKNVQEIKGDAKRHKAALEQLRRQLELVSTHANEKITSMQNELQGYREFHHNQVSEFKEFVEQDRLDRKEFEERYTLQYRQLKEEYDKFREAQFDEKRQMLRDQQDILQAMQAQFDEYRTTAEFLFNAEVAKLEEKLNMQAIKYDHEIKYVIRAKDLSFDEMVTMKDAKIMNLIEGTDLRTMLVQHQTEIMGLHRTHQKEMEKAAAHAEEEKKRALAELHRELAASEATVVKLGANKKALESRIAETFALVEQKNRALQLKDLASQQDAAVFERKIADVTARMEGIAQEREQLRHKVIRLKYQMQGGGSNETAEQMVRRLALDLADLQRKYDALLLSLDSRETARADAEARLLVAKRTQNLLQTQLDERTVAFRRLTEAFGEMLSGGPGAVGATRRGKAERPLAQVLQGPLSSAETASEAQAMAAIVSEVAALGITASRSLLFKSTHKPHHHPPQSSPGPPATPPALVDAGTTNGPAGSPHAAGSPHPTTPSQSPLPGTGSPRQPRVKVRLPKEDPTVTADAAKETISDLERAYTYLKRFKDLSRAFTRTATAAALADFGSHVPPEAADAPANPYETVKLYKDLDHIQAVHAEVSGIYTRRPPKLNAAGPAAGPAAGAAPFSPEHPQKAGHGTGAGTHGRSGGNEPGPALHGTQGAQGRRDKQAQPSTQPRVAGFNPSQPRAGPTVR